MQLRQIPEPSSVALGISSGILRSLVMILRKMEARGRSQSMLIP